MKYFPLIIIYVFIVMPFFHCDKQPSESENKTGEYQLVWSDEFETDGPPNPAHWTFEHGFVRNEELQWYQEENAYCKDGFLIIEGKRVQLPNPNYSAGSSDWRKNRKVAHYTSSSLLTRGLKSWQYGRFEMRAKIDTRPGLWPAFWTLGVIGDWPHNGEVDIMEYYSGKILANIAWGAEEKWKPVWDSYKVPLSGLTANDSEWSNKFHVWRMDWDENSINIYMDDILLNSADLSTTINRDAAGLNPFHQPHYIIINLAIGGHAGGDPSQTMFPAFYEIDYVRVYQK